MKRKVGGAQAKIARAGWSFRKGNKKKPLRPNIGVEGLSDLPGAGQYIPPIPPCPTAEAFSFSGSS